MFVVGYEMQIINLHGKLYPSLAELK